MFIQLVSRRIDRQHKIWRLGSDKALVAQNLTRRGHRLVEPIPQNVVDQARLNRALP
jgi:outer membrane PBP1 activator LpoA protein